MDDCLMKRSVVYGAAMGLFLNIKGGMLQLMSKEICSYNSSKQTCAQ
jgi:hypothetical protein